MNITLLLTGKTDKDYLSKGMQLYHTRLKHYVNFELKVLPDVKKKLSEKEHKMEEARYLMKSIGPGDVLVLFDENGKQYSSAGMASFIESFMLSGTRHLVFAIGGPYGFADEVYSRANHKISISMMTFPHQLIRLLILEQIYRAFTILRGEPYHHA